MASFEVTLKDRTVESVADADAYAQEGQMTTFFRSHGDRDVIDSWSTRLFSIRTSEILMIRRAEPADGLTCAHRPLAHPRLRTSA